MSEDNTSQLYTTKVAEENQKKAMAAIKNATTDHEKQVIDEKYENLNTSEEAKAATYFSAGRNRLGLKTLVDKLNQTKGKAGIKTWYMLLDGYEIDNNKKLHSRLSEHFVKRFKMSPPQFSQYKKTDIANQEFGRNVLKIDGRAAQITETKKKDFLEAAKSSQIAKADLLNAEINRDEEGKQDCIVIKNILQSLRKLNIECSLLGDVNIISILEEVIEDNKSNPENKKDIDIYFWDLYLEILQWRQNENLFEDTALDYALIFHVSSESFEHKKRIKIDNSNNNIFSVESEVLNINQIKREIENKIYNNLTAHLDFSNVKRITIEAAASLEQYLEDMNIKSENVVIHQPNEIVTTILSMAGLADKVNILPRKR